MFVSVHFARYMRCVFVSLIMSFHCYFLAEKARIKLRMCKFVVTHRNANLQYGMLALSYFGSLVGNSVPLPSPTDIIRFIRILFEKNHRQKSYFPNIQFFCSKTNYAILIFKYYTTQYTEKNTKVESGEEENEDTQRDYICAFLGLRAQHAFSIAFHMNP